MAVSITIFAVVYILIILEKYTRIHRSVVALGGAVAVILSGILKQDTDFEAVGEAVKGATGYIDVNTIGLLFSMMLIVAITKRTGLFAYLAMLSAKISKGNAVVLMLVMAWVTGIVSAFLDNVTTVILMAPVSIMIAKELKLKPFPFLVTQIIFSNLGGTATLIGDPPNIMIGSLAGLSFLDFTRNLTLIVLAVMVVCSAVVVFIFRKDLKMDSAILPDAGSVSLKGLITDRVLLVKCLIVFGLTVVGFVLHDKLHLQPATVALTGALILILLSRVRLTDMLKEEIDWSTLLFFIGLFIVIGGLEKSGWLEFVSGKIYDLTGDNLFLMAVLILWFSAFMSAVIDNIPFTATMIPVIMNIAYGLHPELGHTLSALHHPDVMPLWWALSLGVCFGGNGTLVGASANIVVAGMSEKTAPPVNFINFTRVGLPVMVVSVLVANFLLWVLFYAG